MTQKGGALTGYRYQESLNDQREVWLHGSKVNVSMHPDFKGIITTLSSLYDLQHTEPYRDKMTFLSSNEETRLSVSYLLPRNKQQLRQKTINSNIWARESWGQLPRAPDFMSNILVGLYDFRNELRKENAVFYENVVNYYRFCSENDLVLTHAIGDPQIDRSSNIIENEDLALRVIKKTKEGVVVRGAKQLATLAPVSNEVFVYLSPSFALREKTEFVIWFAIPISTAGLKVMCRESKSVSSKGCSRPFSAQFDEQDAMLFFDDVFIPSERIFLLENANLAYEGFFRINAWALFSNAIRSYQRLKVFVALASMMAKAIGTHEFRQTLDQLGELASYAEIMRLMILGMEADAKMTSGGLLAPGDATAPGIFIAQNSMRMIEIIREIGASGLIMYPNEEDLCNDELKPHLEKYMRGQNISFSKKARLFCLANELVNDYYGLRQELYERWNRGDLVRNRIGLYRSFNLENFTSKIAHLIEKPLDRTFIARSKIREDFL